jgi:PAS domain S-box-containing protein
VARKTVRVTAVRDLSEQQAALRERKIVESALLDTKRRYQALFNHKSDSVFINSFTETGKPSQFIEVNDDACASLGYSRAELLIMSPSDILPKNFHCKRETMETLHTQKYATDEVLHQSKEGKIFPVELCLVERDISRRSIEAIRARDFPRGS